MGFKIFCDGCGKETWKDRDDLYTKFEFNHITEKQVAAICGLESNTGFLCADCTHELMAMLKKKRESEQNGR